MIGLAIGLGMLLHHRLNLSWRWWWLGGLTFILSQIGHLPFNWGLTQIFTLGWLPVPPESWRLAFNAIVLGLSAGTWEGMARYIAFRWYARDARTTKGSLMLGAGHGGIEAILLGIYVLGFFINMVVLRSMDLSATLPAEQIAETQRLLETYWSAEWYLTLLGALERIFALTMHLAVSMLVVQVFLRRNWAWLMAGIGWHALTDGLAVYINGIWGGIAAEVTLACIAAFSVLIIWRLYRIGDTNSHPGEDQDSTSPQPQSQLTSGVDDLEDLDASRYHN